MHFSTVKMNVQQLVSVTACRFSKRGQLIHILYMDGIKLYIHS
jgi:hypothetical protein